MPSSEPVVGSRPLLHVFRFRVTIPDFPPVRFAKVSGLRYGFSTSEINQATSSITVKLPDRVETGDVTLSKGMWPSSAHQELRSWMEQVKKAAAIWNTSSKDITFKKMVFIEALDRSGEAAWMWVLNGAWPKEIEYPDLDAGSSDILIDSMVLACDWIDESIPG